MLILTRKPMQRIILNDGEIVITFLGLKNGQLQLGLEAPKRINIIRDEIRYRFLSKSKNEKINQRINRHRYSQKISVNAPDFPDDYEAC